MTHHLTILVINHYHLFSLLIHHIVLYCIVGLTLQPDLRNLGSVTHVIIESVAPNSEAQRLGMAHTSNAH